MSQEHENRASNERNILQNTNDGLVVSIKITDHHRFHTKYMASFSDSATVAPAISSSSGTAL